MIDAVLNWRLGAFVGGLANGAGSRRLLDEAWCAHLANALRGDAKIRAESGALRVIPGLHSKGRVDPKSAEALRSQHGETVVPVARGGALVMRPLLLHASSKATSEAPRRVLHFVFGPRLSDGPRLLFHALVGSFDTPESHPTEN